MATWTIALSAGAWAALAIGALVIVLALIGWVLKTFDDGTFDDSRKDKKPR